MNYSKNILSNGLRIITMPMPSLESVTVTVWIKTGSRNENEKNNGVSHFLEHMFFKGTTNRPTAKQIAEEIDQIGGVQNAGTSKEYTEYYIKCRADKIEVAFDLLSDMTLNSLLDAKEIEREKGTIIEEIRMYEDTPMMNIGEVFEGLIYSGHTLGMDIAGTEKTVSEMKRNDFVDYRSNFYHAENMILTVAGGVDEKKVLELSLKYFSKLENRNLSFKSKNEFGNKQNSPKTKLHNKKKEQAHVILGFIADGKNYEHKYAQTLLSTILGGGMSSRMFTEVRERRGLAYSIRTSMDRYTDIGYLGTYAGLDTKRAVEAVKVMLNEHYQLISNPKSLISNSELVKAKEFLKGHLALALEDTSDVSSFFGDQELFSEKVLTPEEVFKKIDKVTMDEVNYEIKRLFVPERLNLAIIGPYENTTPIFDKSNYVSAFGYLKYDSFNQKYFPKKGWSFSGDLKTFLYSSDYTNEFERFSIAKADVGIVFEPLKRATIKLQSEGGFAIGERSISFFDFVLGGYGFVSANNIRPFMGYDFLSLAGDSYVKGTVTLDYEFYKKHHVNFTGNFANLGNRIFEHIEGWLTKPKYTGYGFGYGMESIIGPLEIKHSWSPDTKDHYTWFSVGFWF